MGYDDEITRRRERRSRARQSAGTTGGRNIDYRIGEEPGRKEPGLNLITDQRQSRGAAEKRSGGRSKNRSQSMGSEADERRSQRHKTGQNRHEQKKSDIFCNPAKRKKDKKKRRKICIILLEVLVLLCVIGFAGYSYLTSHLDLMTKLEWDPDKVRNPEISTEKQEQMKGYWTIAVFGVDSRNSSLGSGNNSDVNIICNINQDTGEIKLVSVYRDTYLNISEKNSYNKINAAYLQGGPEQAVMALNKNMDLDIEEYATFNWKAVADAINILGGIDVELSDAEFYYINAFITETVQATGIGSTHLKKAGMNHLDGVQAVAYGRLRLMDSDYARTERQRKVISLAFDKVKQADWNTINCIIQTVFPQVSTSIDIGDLLMMGRKVTRYHLTETMGFPAARGEASIGKKGACVVPQTLVSNVTELHRFLFGDEQYMPTETVQSISRKILSDSGKSQEAKPVESVGTGGGITPVRPKEESKAEETSEAVLSETSSLGEGEAETDGTLPDSGSDKPEDDDMEGEMDSAGNMILRPGGSSASEEREEETAGPGRPGEAADPEDGEEGETVGTGRPGGNAGPEKGKEGEAAGTGRPGGTAGSEEGKEETIGPDRPGDGGKTGGSIRPGSTIYPSGGFQTDTGVILYPGMRQN